MVHISQRQPLCCPLTMLYTSDWEATSSSAHPALWKSASVSSSEMNSSEEKVRLPSVNEILLRIFRDSATQTVPLPPLALLERSTTGLSPNQSPKSQQEVGPVSSLGPESSLGPQSSPPSYPPSFTPDNGAAVTYTHGNNTVAAIPRQPPQNLIRPRTDVTTGLNTQSDAVPHGPANGHSTASPILTFPPRRRGRKKKANSICSQCGLTQTPEWRRGPDGVRTLCNACGLFYSKLVKSCGDKEARMVFLYKKIHNEVGDRMVPSPNQIRWYCNYISEHHELR